MKFNFRKIASVMLGSSMILSTAGFALAASYPAPFIKNGKLDAAVIVGADSAASDWVAAIDIANDLSGMASSAASGSTSTGGDSFKIEKSSTKFHLGKGLTNIVSVDITDDDMPTLLTAGKFIDSNNDEKDYTQKITPANITLEMFDDDDYADDSPTVGFRLANNNNILNYTLEFTDEPTWNKIATTDLPFMGKTYYVLTTNHATNTSITLLDSAAETILAEGESTSITVDGKSYDISVNFIGSTPEVKFDINGEITNSLQEAQTYKLNDGAFVGVKDILYTSKDSGISKVEFSIGAGKLVLTNNTDVDLNDDTISDLKAEFFGTDTLQKIKIVWNAETDLFVTPDSEVTMPGFGAVKLSFGGMVYPAEEVIDIDVATDGVTLKNFPLKDGTANIPILYYNGSAYTAVGKDASENFLSVPGGYNSQAGSLGGIENGTFSNITFDANTDDSFIASWNDTSSSESYLLRANGFTESSGKQKVDIERWDGSAFVNLKTGVKNGSTVSIGNIELTIGVVDKDKSTVVIKPGTNVNFHDLYSEEGLFVDLPWINVSQILPPDVGLITAATCAANLTAANTEKGELGSNLTLINATTTVYCNNLPTSYNLSFAEEDKDENAGIGVKFNFTFAETSANDEVSVTGIQGTATGSGSSASGAGTDNSGKEIGSTDVFRSFTYGAIASEILWDKSGDQQTAKITYHGDESYGELFISSPEATITPGSSGGSGGTITPVKDTDVSSVSEMNLLVVGGSCINKVAAEILGSSSPLCASEFTDKTGAGPGQYIIKTVASPRAAANSGKIAMLVAGYAASDTVTAVNKAKTSVTDVDTEQVYPISTA